MNRWERKEKLGHGAVTRIARRLKVSPTRVSRVLNDHEQIPRIQRAIAKEIGEPVDVVFRTSDAVPVVSPESGTAA